MNSVIIGGGLTGLILAHRLHTVGHKVTVLEARDVLGGTFRKPTLTFAAATRENIDLCEWWRGHSPAPINFAVADHRPEIFDEGRWRPFAGFGEVGFQSISELALLSHTQELQLTPSADQIVRTLIEQLPVVAQLQSEVTEIKIFEGSANQVIVNGDREVRADHVFFTGDPAALNNLIVGDALSAKYRTRLAKMSSWTAVLLELNHAQPLCDTPDMRIFSHNAKDYEPVFGRVEGSVSRWMTLIPAERTDDHEFSGQCIRHIKRQLKRAWPEALEGPQDEKIYVYPGAFGQNSLKTKTHWLFPEIPNLFLANHTLASQSGLMGALEAAKGIDDLLTGAALTALDEISPDNA